MAEKDSILIVDDSRLVRMVLASLLAGEYDLMEATNGKMALEILEKHAAKIAVILLDMVMPEMDGFELLEVLKEQKYLHAIPVIMITAEESERAINLAYELGASEVVPKPFDKNVVRHRIRNIAELYRSKNALEKTVAEQKRSLDEQTQKMIHSNELMIDALSTVIEYRSLESGQHISRIRGFTQLLLEDLAPEHPQENLTPDRIRMIARASAMHDIGKIAIPDRILLKPGPLEIEEFAVMKTHTVKGCEILFRLENLDDKQYLVYCHDICLYHHERWDGGGYPDGLVGNKIPLTAQVVAIVDAYDALTHMRVYKPAFSHLEAVEMILAGQCGSFSPALLASFRRSLPKIEKLAEKYADVNL